MNIYIHNGENVIPEDETCYIIAKGGMYLRKKLDLIESLTPVDKISFLEDVPVFAKLNIPKISLIMFGNILAFFKEVYRLYHSEAVVLVFYNKNNKTYKLYIPEQEVSGGSVSYKSDKTIKDHMLVGTIHSHSSMTAFHSSVDVGDEKNFDGIHITIGKINECPMFDICASVVANGLRIPVPPEDYIEGLEVREYTKYFPHMFRPAFEEINGEKVYKNTVKTTIDYTITDSSDDILSFNPKWLDKVKEKVYPVSGLSRYMYVDGKLVKIGGERSEIKRDYQYYGEHFFGYDDFDYAKLVSASQPKNPCQTCIYRNEKINLNQKVKEKKLTYNKVNDQEDNFGDNDLFTPMCFEDFD